MKPRRCESHLFDGPEWQCHRDHGHMGDHIHYHETSGGCSGWANTEERVLWAAPDSDIDVEWVPA